jgi:phosphoenolpyruvate synthase/pyruvate phosphate dikinase
MTIHWLGDANCGDRSAVGGKAANLSRLSEGFRVPPGFALVDPDSVGTTPSPAETDDASLRFPPALEAPLAEAYAALAHRVGASDPSVAVRSSAVEEDSATISFAGQHETLLNVKGIEDVQEAVMHCWASAMSERALEYRRGQGLPPPTGRLPVLVQAQVVADASAVVFTTNPVTGDESEIVVNVTWGLGESLVGGTVNPDSYIVARGDLDIASKEIASKERMTVAVPEGSREVGVPFRLKTRPAVEDQQVLDMARLGLELEELFGWPTDVECCWREGELFLLQCRPVTAVSSDGGSG